MYYWIFSNKEPVLYVVYVYIMTINVSELKIENWIELTNYSACPNYAEAAAATQDTGTALWFIPGRWFILPLYLTPGLYQNDT